MSVAGERRAASGRSVQRKEEGAASAKLGSLWMQRRLAFHRRVVYFNPLFVPVDGNLGSDVDHSVIIDVSV